MIQRPRTAVAPPPAPPIYRAPGTYYDYEEPPPGRSFWPWLLALLLIVAGAFGGWFLYQKVQNQLNNSKPVAVPNVLLLQKDLAKLHIRQAGLTPRVKYGYSDSAVGTVYDQNPSDGTKIAKGSPVILFVSRGKQKIPVPNVVGQDLTSAVQLLAAAGLQPKITRIYSGAAADSVTAQQPHAGDKVLKGTVVHINVSRGAKPVPVPDVTGQPYANAASALTGAGFQVARVDIQSDKPQGVVVAEDPPQGTPVPNGTKITLSVSKGPSTTQVPDVTGQPQSTAETILSQAGLTPSVVYDPVTDPSQEGVVLSEDPQQGSDATSGEVIIIHVGQLQNGTPGGDGGTTTTSTTTTQSTTTTP